MTFHAFLTQKYPLYADTEIKVNLTVKQLCELNEEFVRETAPMFEVKVDAEAIFCHHNGTYTQVENSKGELVCCKCRRPVKSL